MSNRRNKTKAAKTPFRFGGAKARVKHMPATSSITTNCGSEQSEALATRALTTIPIAVSSNAANTNGIGPKGRTRRHTGSAPIDPTVPGLMGDRPQPNQVASQNAKGSRSLAVRITDAGNLGMVWGTLAETGTR